MSNILINRILLVWGCDPARQYEAGWLNWLLQPVRQCASCQINSFAVNDLEIVLVESGILSLERSVSLDQLNELHQQRLSRLQAFAKLGKYSVIHLSDEEGVDGDSLYPMLSDQTIVWRNFAYPRFQQRTGLYSFPIGPRVEFLEPRFQIKYNQPASLRDFPWGFMGTLWPSGSRGLATSLFLRGLPHGFFYGCRGFARGLPIHSYQAKLLQCSFVLCPEGDRHLDTFRLYEALQSGCIPVLVDQRSMAADLLGFVVPFPVFDNWLNALDWVKSLLANPVELDKTQELIGMWWQQHRNSLSRSMRQTLTTKAF